MKYDFPNKSGNWFIFKTICVNKKAFDVLSEGYYGKMDKIKYPKLWTCFYILLILERLMEHSDIPFCKGRKPATGKETGRV